jgi:zinc/manganese transport system substrate-binding protein
MKSYFAKITALIAVAISTLLANVKPALAAVDVVTSIPELGAIAKEVGGSDVSVYSVAQPNRDYHTIEPRASDVARIARAALVVRSGMGFDGWMDALMNAAKNTKVNTGGEGYVDASADVPPIEVPKESISGASGDVHPDGNPHYYYDPVYAKFIARNIARGLIRVDAKNADDYRKNLKGFYAAVDARMRGWNEELKPYQGKGVVTYHKNFNYFLRRFGLYQYGTLEERPGIAPSAGHLANLIKAMQKDKVRAVLVESIYPRRWPDFLKRQTGIDYAVGPYSVENLNPGSYLALVDKLVDAAKTACKQ